MLEDGDCLVSNFVIGAAERKVQSILLAGFR
jgi:hypothetical protein